MTNTTQRLRRYQLYSTTADGRFRDYLGFEEAWGLTGAQAILRYVGRSFDGARIFDFKARGNRASFTYIDGAEREVYNLRAMKV